MTLVTYDNFVKFALGCPNPILMFDIGPISDKTRTSDYIGHLKSWK